VEEISRKREIVIVNVKEVLQITYKFKGYSEDRELCFTQLGHENHANKEIILYEE